MRTKQFNKLVWATVSALALGIFGTATAAPEIEFKAKVDGKVIERAGGLRVYRLQAAKPDVDSLSKQLFGGEIKGAERVQVGSVTGVSGDGGSKYLMVDRKTGYMQFTRGMAAQIDDKPGELPNDEAAVKIARAFLEKNRLGPGHGDQMVLGRVGHIRSASFDPKTEKKGPVRDQMLTVHFARQINDIPVVGSGSKILVWIGDGNQIVGAGRRWSDIGKGKPVPKGGLRSAEQLTGDIRKFLMKENSGAQHVEIVNVALVYYDNGGGFMQPAVSYEANIRRGKLRHRYLGHTALLNDPPERVGPAPVGGKAREMLKKSPENLKPKPKKDND